MNEEQNLVILITVGAVVFVGLVLMLVARIRQRTRRPSIEIVPERPQPPEHPPPHPSSPYLESLDISDGGRIYALERPRYLIGRAAHADICIDEGFRNWETVSREHAWIFIKEDRVIVQDNNSMNGTGVNGRRTGRNILRHGWQLEIGGVAFLYRRPDSVDESMPIVSETPASAATPLPSRSAVAGATIRLREPKAGFAPLPDGALLDSDRYEILETRQGSTEVNDYLVRDNRPLYRCGNPDCGFVQESTGSMRCSACGGDLNQAKPTYQTFSMREAANPADFGVAGELLKRGVNHSALLLPQAHFEETPYADSKRAYLVETEHAPRLAATLPVPQELPLVLDWGLQLTGGMAVLHNMNITLGHIDLDRITIEDNGRTARWINVDKAEFNPPGEQQFARHKLGEDVQMLAELLLYLATGLAGQSPATALTLPAAVRNLFSRAMTQQPQWQSFQSAEEFGLALESALAEYRPRGSIRLSTGQRSDTGRQRRLNEDGLLVLVVDQVTKSIGRPLGLFAVADGMGGHAAGDVAAQLTIDAIRQKAIENLLTPTSKSLAYDEWIGDAITAANRLVYDRRRQSDTDMGNTLVLAVMTGDAAFIGNVGDSRAYVITQSGIRQITTDHSLVARLVAFGTISPEEARNHPQRNVIYRTIGDQLQAEFDLFTLQLQSGECLLLCSDGLSGMVTDQEIYDIVSQATSPQQACDRLVQAANDAGGTDNITVVVAQIEKDG